MLDEIKAVQEIEKAFADRDMATIKRMFMPDHISVAARYGGALRLPEQLKTIRALQRATFDVALVDVTLPAPGVALVTVKNLTPVHTRVKPCRRAR